MQPYDHFSPKTLPEALELLGKLNGKCRVIAGGTDLMLQMKVGEIAPEALVNLKHLPELKGIQTGVDGGLRLGALVTLRELTRSPALRARYPALAHAASLMASEQIRSFATLGGNLCNAAPSADLAPPLIALEAQAWLAGRSAERHLPLEEFFQGPGVTALSPGEILRAVTLPAPRGEAVYLKHAPRAFMDIAVVGVAIRLQEVEGVCQNVRIVLGAVAPVPRRARHAEAVLNNQPLSPAIIQQTAETAAQESAPIDDLRSSASYRRRMVAVLVKRGLNSFIEEMGT